MIASSFRVLIRFVITMLVYYIIARFMGWVVTLNMWWFAAAVAAIFAVVSEILYQSRRPKEKDNV